MPAIWFRSVNFLSPTYRHLNGSACFQANLADLVQSACTVGKENWLELSRYSPYSSFEVGYRSMFIQAHIREEAGMFGSFMRTAIYENSEPSEKVIVSYTLGMTLAQLFSCQFLDAPWLGHVKTLERESGVVFNFTNGNVRPDLVGLTSSGKWIVIESKNALHNPGQSRRRKFQQMRAQPRSRKA